MSAMRFPCLAFLCLSLLLCGCSGSKTSSADTAGSNGTNSASIPKTDLNAKDKITDLVVGKDPRVAEVGDTVWVQFRGTLTNGSEFDSNFGIAKEPFSFT